MGSTNAHAGRRGATALVLMATITLLVMLAFMAVSTSIGAQDAQALSTFDSPVNGIGPCATCHPQSTVHSQASHSAVFPTCSNCHPDGDTSKPPLPSKCGVCHGGVTTILAKDTHTNIGCGTTDGCHGYSSPAPTPTATPSTTPTPTPTPTATVVATKVTLKVAPKTIRLRKTVKASGLATPTATLKGKKVTVRVDRKKGAKWVKVTSKKVTVTSTGAYSWKYKPGKKGTYHVTASIAKSATYKASKSKAMTFKVK
jgi:hypothetical protein